ncbi:hypothetical protein SLA2020_282290 [Shorea laevis]
MEIMSFPWFRFPFFNCGANYRSAWRVLRWAWVRPKALERSLRDQGLTGNSYSLLFGDLKEISKMTNQARSKPINFTNDIAPRVVPFSIKMSRIMVCLSYSYPYCLLLLIIQFGIGRMLGLSASAV